MPEQQTGSGLWVSTRWGTKDSRIPMGPDTVGPRDLATSGFRLPSRFRDFQSFLGAVKVVPWVNACVTLKAYSFASNPWEVVDEEDEPVSATADPLRDLFRRPNPLQSGFEFWELFQTNLELVGNAYLTLEERDGFGRPRQLWLPNPARMQVVPGRDGPAGYVYDAGTTAGTSWTQSRYIPYGPDEVIHVKLPNPTDDWYGLGNVEAMQTLLDTAVAMQEHERSYFQSGGRIIGTLSTDQTFSDDEFQRLKEDWQRSQRDPQQRVRVAILEKGLKYVPIAEGLRSLDITNIDRAKRDQILAVFGVPTPKLGILENAQYKSDEADRFFWSETMHPAFDRAEDGIQPLVDLWDPAWRLRYERRNFEDDVAKLQNATSMYSSGLFTLDEARVYTGADPLPGGTGEVLLLSTAYTPIPVSGFGDYADESLAPPVPPQPAAPDVQPTPSPGDVPSAAGPGGGDNVVHLADHVPGMKALSAADRIEREIRRLQAYREQQRAQARPHGPRQKAAAPMQRVSRYDRDAKAARPMRTSTRQPALAAHLRRQFTQYRTGQHAEAARQVRQAFAEQRKAITRGRTLDRLLSAAKADPEEMRRQLAELWPQAPVQRALGEVHRRAGEAGETTAARALAPRRRKAAGAAQTKQFSPQAARLMAERIQGIDDTTRSAIADVVAEGARRGYSPLQVAAGVPDEDYAGVAGVFDDATDWRAEMIARDALRDGYNLGASAAYRDAGVQMVEMQDGDAFDETCAEIDGQVVSIDEGEDLLASEHPNGTRSSSPIVDDTTGTGDATDMAAGGEE